MRHARYILHFFCAAAVCSWLFPQILFRDCIRAVFPGTDGKAACAEETKGGDVCTEGTDDRSACAEGTEGGDVCADAGALWDQNCALTQEDYLDLFHIDKSRYKIAWKFFGND